MGKYSDFPLSYSQIGGEGMDFTGVTKLQNVVKSLCGFGRCCQEIRDICIYFEPCLKVHTPVNIKASNLVKI